MEKLGFIARHLELLEETIIYRFLDRVQFAAHPELYQPQTMDIQLATKNDLGLSYQDDFRQPVPYYVPNDSAEYSSEEILRLSLLGLRLRAHEAMEQEFERYNVVEEFPFSPFTPPFSAAFLAEAKARAQTTSPAILQKLGLAKTSCSFEADLPLPLAIIREISQCKSILQCYLAFLYRYCHQPKGRNKEQIPTQQTMQIALHAYKEHYDYGSALEHDVMALQAISRRVHYGAIYVAESKFNSQEKLLRPLIKQWQESCNNSNYKYGEYLINNKDEAIEYQERILDLIIRPEIEKNILQRVYDKTLTIQLGSQGQAETNNNITLHRFYLQPDALRDFYANCVIPLTKQGELAYLYRRV